MTNSHRLATVRLCFANWLAQNDAPVPAGMSSSAEPAFPIGTASPSETASPAGDEQTDEPNRGETADAPATLPIRPVAELPYFREAILIRKGFYCGRRFDAGGFEAVWFFEEDQLKIYDPSDEVRAVLRGDEIDAIANADESSDESEHIDTQRRAA